MDYSNVCRTCLGTGPMNPIFGQFSDHKKYSTAVYVTAGIEVTPSDGLPQQMCTQCVYFLNDILKFRKKCREVQSKLLCMKIKGDEAPAVKLEEVFAKNEELDEFEFEIGASEELKEEYAEFVKDEDDKPLKYLVTDNAESNSEADIVFIDNLNENFDRNNDLEDIEQNVYTDLDMPFEFDIADPGQNKVKCKICSKILSIRSIDVHMSTRHPGRDYRKVKCDLCDKYVLKEKINRHKMLMHGTSLKQSKCIRCGYCKSEFDNRQILIDHVTSCTAKKKKRKSNESTRELAECDICHKTMQRASLKMHKAVKHAGLGPVCEHCGKRFGNKFRLNEHYRAKHGYEKFKCSYCDFQSAGNMAMRNHERRHRGEKPFVCETCGAKFHAGYLLSQHKQSHRTERPIKCDLCSASFKANNSLHMHKIACHSKTLFKCSMCERTYSCRHYVLKHLRHYHEYRGPVGELDKVSRPATKVNDEQ